nr:MAG TPA: NinG recombination protein [Caudoviricetes sp.]
MSFDFQIDAEPEWFESSDDETPIHSFGGLKKLLTDMGYNVGKAQAYKPIEVSDVTLEDIRNGAIEFTDEGIFVNAEGVRHKVFLYKRDYHLDIYGKPRAHIRKCDVINRFSNGNSVPLYRRANTDSVWVRDMDDGYIDKQVTGLNICSHCIQIAQEAYPQMTVADFIELLKNVDDAEPEENVEVDIFGYTKDWEQISKTYRETHDYTCENCGIHITDPFDQQYIHTHHRNARKTDNRTSNLQCLCIRCHAAVDEFHKERFNSGANKILLNEFNAKYPPKPKRNIAKQIDTYDDDLPF